MKEFDKWYKKQDINYQNYSIGAEKAWRAALKCIENMIIYQSDGPSNPKDLMQRIYEELEE